MRTGAVPNLDELADRLAIYDVLVQHSRGVDRADSDILKSAYWPEAMVNYGGFNGVAHEFCEMLPGSIKRYRATQHSITNVRFEIDGASARTETYVTAYHYLADAAEGDSEMTYLGRYLDTLERRDGCWKIIHRKIVMDWNQNADASAVWTGPPFDGIALGDRNPDDPAVEFFSG